MYTINFIENFIVKEEHGGLFVKLLKISNFCIHILILLVIILSMFKYKSIENINNRIIDTKKTIENKRISNKISDIEKEWEVNYYKLLAVKEQITGSTKYGYIFKDLGTFIPEEKSVVNISIQNDIGNSTLILKKDFIEKLTNVSDYSSILATAFEKSTYFTQDFEVVGLDKEIIGKKDIDVIKLNLKVKPRI